MGLRAATHRHLEAPKHDGGEGSGPKDLDEESDDLRTEDGSVGLTGEGTACEGAGMRVRVRARVERAGGNAVWQGPVLRSLMDQTVGRAIVLGASGVGRVRVALDRQETGSNAAPEAARTMHRKSVKWVVNLELAHQA